MSASPIPSTLGATISINLKLLCAFGFGWLSWAVWPTAPEWWGLGLLSILAGLAALQSAIDATRTMFQVQKREKAIIEYLAQGSAPKSSEMASGNRLDDAGMR